MTDLPENINIREFAPGDRAMVEEFFAQMGGESKAFFNRGDWNHQNAIKFFDGSADADTVYFLAELDGLMLGYVFLWDLNRGVPWLGIAVREEYKGRHLGRLLIEHASKYAQAAGKGGILLTTHVVNLRGQGLYERMGFERLGTHTSGEVLYLKRF